MQLSTISKCSSMFCALVGALHLILGISLIYLVFLGSEVLFEQNIIDTHPLMGILSTYSPLATTNLVDNSSILILLIAVILGGTIYLWRRSPQTLLFCAIAGLIADVGYLIYMDWQSWLVELFI